MRKYLLYIINKIKNYPLNMKIFLIIAFVVILTSLASIIGTQVVSRSYNDLLYRALAGSLNYSAEDISKKLSNIESMTNSIISNQYIRKSLITLTDEPASPITNRNVDNTITASLIDYYQNYKNNDISYINLHNNKFVSTSYKSKTTEVPIKIYDSIKTAASKNSGYACWITDYCNSYGLFLGRDSRRVYNLKFETLGTVVVQVDMDRLIHSSTQSILQNTEVQYIIYENNKEIYHSKGLQGVSSNSLNRQLKNRYDIISLENKRYFCTRGIIENNNWEYICLVPYSQIENTILFTQVISFLILAAAITIVILLSRILVKSITNDFGKLVDKMKSFGKDETKIPATDYAYENRMDEAGILHQQFHQMTIEIHKLIQQNYVNELLSKDAKLKSLESQINPHFLYNALESVNWRAKAIGAEDISAMVISLGDLLRATLSNKSNNFTVRHELDIVNNYMTIQKMRFDKERLDYKEIVTPDILDAELPQMTIQPLIHNAITYAMEVITETCYITLNGFQDNDIIHIQVINNGSQFEDDLIYKLENRIVSPRGIGIGLLNIHQRIQLIYGSNYGLTLYNSDEDHAVAEIIIPKTKG